MAKTFSAIKKSLGLLDFIPIGKYKGCRVDSIVEEDYEYLIFMITKKIFVASPELAETLTFKFSADSIVCREYDDPLEGHCYSSEDIPF